ncbi:MAG: hypothetical protein RSE41_08155 [Clostridia bacterium]
MNKNKKIMIVVLVIIQISVIGLILYFINKKEDISINPVIPNENEKANIVIYPNVLINYENDLFTVVTNNKDKDNQYNIYESGEFKGNFKINKVNNNFMYYGKDGILNTFSKNLIGFKEDLEVKSFKSKQEIITNDDLSIINKYIKAKNLNMLESDAIKKTYNISSINDKVYVFSTINSILKNNYASIFYINNNKFIDIFYSETEDNICMPYLDNIFSLYNSSIIYDVFCVYNDELGSFHQFNQINNDMYETIFKYKN